MVHVRHMSFFDAVLRKIDEGVFTNIVALFKSGEQNRILTNLGSVWDAASKEKGKDIKKRMGRKTQESASSLVQLPRLLVVLAQALLRIMLRNSRNYAIVIMLH